MLNLEPPFQVPVCSSHKTLFPFHFLKNQFEISTPSIQFTLKHLFFSKIILVSVNSLSCSKSQKSFKLSMTPASEDSSPTTSTTEEKTKSSTEQHGLNFHFSALNNIPPWAKFVLGSAVLFAIPLLSRVVKSQGLKKTAEAAVKAVDELVEAADKVVEAAEKLAEAAEKVLEEVVEALPSGGLKEAAMKLEEIAAYVEKRAEFADSLLDSVDEVLDDTAIKLRSIKVVEEVQDIHESGVEKVVIINIVDPPSLT